MAAKKGGRRALRGGKPRVWSRHDGWRGRCYHEHFAALAATYPIRTALARQLAGLAAAQWVARLTAERAWETACRARESGRGRRPSQREINGLAKRRALEGQDYAAAVGRLAALATANGHGLDLARAIAQAQRGQPT